jgi:hypothetical protein
MTSTLGFMLVSALMLLVASVSSASLVYKASCTGANAVPPVSTKATGSVSITLVNSSYASGYFYATNINLMTMAHLHSGTVGKNGPAIVWAFNATYGPISGSVKASFTFNPSVKNVSALLSSGLAYFNIHTTANPAGELRGQLIGPGNISYPAPPMPLPVTNSDDSYTSSGSVKCASRVSNSPPSGYSFNPQVTLDKKFTFACGNISKTSYYQGAVTDSDISISVICNNITFCAGFIIFYDGPPFNEDTGSLPDQYCLKLTNDPSLFVPAGTTFMKSICYGFFSKKSFNFATSPYPMISAPPDDGYGGGFSHAAFLAKSRPPLPSLCPPRSLSPQPGRLCPKITYSCPPILCQMQMASAGL